MAIVELDTLPDLTGLLAGAARSALPGPLGSGTEDDPSTGLPGTHVVVRDVPVTLDDTADYARVCGFRLRSAVPVTQPHLLGFPLGVWLMTRPDFPFGLLGLVHVANRIDAHDDVHVGDTVDVTARLAGLRGHDRGALFDTVVEVARDDHVVWSSTSTYLRRGSPPAGLAAGTAAATVDPVPAVAATVDASTVDPNALPFTAEWSLPGDLGRDYGAVSGDRNPIHLSAVSAKAFGFPRAIAHGMWTTAAALAGLGALPRPCAVDVAFKKPVLLPGTVEYATQRRPGADGGDGSDGSDGGGWAFGLRNRDGIPHLAGVVVVG